MGSLKAHWISQQKKNGTLELLTQSRQNLESDYATAEARMTLFFKLLHSFICGCVLKYSATFTVHDATTTVSDYITVKENIELRFHYCLGRQIEEDQQLDVDQQQGNNLGNNSPVPWLKMPLPNVEESIIGMEIINEMRIRHTIDKGPGDLRYDYLQYALINCSNLDHLEIWFWWCYKWRKVIVYPHNTDLEKDEALSAAASTSSIVTTTATQKT